MQATSVVYSNPMTMMIERFKVTELKKTIATLTTQINFPPSFVGAVDSSPPSTHTLNCFWIRMRSGSSSVTHHIGGGVLALASNVL